MKSARRRAICYLTGSCLGWLALCGLDVCAASTSLRITSLKLGEGKATAFTDVPSGFERVTLESLDRLGMGAWIPRAVQRLGGRGAQPSFDLPRTAAGEFLRLSVDASEPWPDSFYQGQSSFTGRPVDRFGPGNSWRRRPYFNRPNSAVDFFVSALAGPAVSATYREPDIWLRRGQMLYVLNPLRGLQVIDLTERDAPRLRATLPLPIDTQMLFPLGSNHVALAGHVACWRPGDDRDVSAALIVDLESTPPRIVQELPIAGSIWAGRLLEDVLYVVSSPYEVFRGPSWIEWHAATLVSAINLAEPLKPVVATRLQFPEGPRSFAISDRWLTVSGEDRTATNRVRVLDITATDGVMKPREVILPDDVRAQVLSLWLIEDVLVLLTPSRAGGERLTVQTYSLSPSAPPTHLASTDFVFADYSSRHVLLGSRVYLAGRVAWNSPGDSLVVLDLTDARRPVATERFDLFSRQTQLLPLSDRLVALGEGENGTVVSLFGLHDPAHPILLSRLEVGRPISWDRINASLATARYVPDLGLLLVPEQQPDQNQLVRRIRLVEIAERELRLRGLVDHDFLLSRAQPHGDRLLFLAQHQLASVDLSQPDQPKLRSVLPLDWPVHLVFQHQDYLLQLSATYDPNGVASPSIKVSLTDAPEAVLAESSLLNRPVLGAAKRENQLFVLQGGDVRFTFDFGGVVNHDTLGGAGSLPSANLVLSVVSLANLPTLKLLGQCEGPAVADATRPFHAVWPRPDLLVWAPGSLSEEAGGGQWSFPVQDGPYVGCFYGNEFWRPGFNESCTGRLLTFAVSDPARLRFVSEVSIPPSSFQILTAPSAANGLVFLSHRRIQFQPVEPATGEPPPEPQVIDDWSCRTSHTNYPGLWHERWYADAVDYTDARAPTLRRPVSIPGPLRGVSPDGSLFYCVGFNTNANGGITEELAALAYDGVSAYRLDAIPLAQNVSQPVLIREDIAFVGLQANTNSVLKPRLESWRLSSEGKLTRVGMVELSATPVFLRSFGSLLAVQLESGVELVDASRVEGLRSVGNGAAGCQSYYPDFADGSLATGLWVPQGAFGLVHVPAHAVRPGEQTRPSR